MEFTMNPHRLPILISSLFFSLLFSLLSSLFFSPVHAEHHSQPTPNKIKHVIYVTLDGVRWQDVYQTHQYFPKLWKQHASKFTFYGLPNSNTTIEAASIPVSLPSYQSQMSGAIQPCR